MDTIKIILNEQGQLETVLTDGETNIQVLKRGQDDSKIDEFEAVLDVADIN